VVSSPGCKEGGSGPQKYPCGKHLCMGVKQVRWKTHIFQESMNFSAQTVSQAGLAGLTSAAITAVWGTLRLGRTAVFVKKVPIPVKPVCPVVSEQNKALINTELLPKLKVRKQELPTAHLLAFRQACQRAPPPGQV
jgi:hypothetical protein